MNESTAPKFESSQPRLYDLTDVLLNRAINSRRPEMSESSRDLLRILLRGVIDTFPEFAIKFEEHRHILPVTKHSNYQPNLRKSRRAIIRSRLAMASFSGVVADNVKEFKVVFPMALLINSFRALAGITLVDAFTTALILAAIDYIIGLLHGLQHGIKMIDYTFKKRSIKFVKIILFVIIGFVLQGFFDRHPEMGTGSLIFGGSKVSELVNVKGIAVGYALGYYFVSALFNAGLVPKFLWFHKILEVFENKRNTTA